MFLFEPVMILSKLYKHYLDREPDPDGIATYSPRIINAIKEIASDITTSKEFQGKPKHQPKEKIVCLNNQQILSQHLMNYPEDGAMKKPPNYSNKIKIVVYAPSAINEKCGGITVLHNLVKSINSLNNDNIIFVVNVR